MNKQGNKQGIVRLWLTQLAVTAFFSALCAIFFSKNAATSAFLGGMVCIIPNAVFAIKVFQYQGALSAKQIVNSFYKGEAFKIIGSGFLFAAVFILCKITPLAFFTSYILILMTQWFAPWIISYKRQQARK